MSSAACGAFLSTACTYLRPQGLKCDIYDRLYFTARPMEDGLAEAIDEGKIGPRDDPKARSKILADEYGWDKDLAKKIWCVSAPAADSWTTARCRSTGQA